MDIYATTQVWSPFEATSLEGLIAADVTAKGNGWTVLRWELTPDQWAALCTDIIQRENWMLYVQSWEGDRLIGRPFDIRAREGRMILRDEVQTIAR